MFQVRGLEGTCPLKQKASVVDLQGGVEGWFGGEAGQAGGYPGQGRILWATLNIWIISLRLMGSL